MSPKILIPALSPTMEQGMLAKWLVSEGDSVKVAGDTAGKHCRSGNGPYILEIKTYRYGGHSMSEIYAEA